jgi:hypothetical protein
MNATSMNTRRLHFPTFGCQLNDQAGVDFGSMDSSTSIVAEKLTLHSSQTCGPDKDSGMSLCDVLNEVKKPFNMETALAGWRRKHSPERETDVTRHSAGRVPVTSCHTPNAASRAARSYRSPDRPSASTPRLGAFLRYQFAHRAIGTADQAFARRC